MLAEDDPVNQEVAKELLEDVGFVVDTVVNGLQALEYTQRFDYAFVLMDMQMPLMDGNTATKGHTQFTSESKFTNHCHDSQRLC